MKIEERVGDDLIINWTSGDRLCVEHRFGWFSPHQILARELESKRLAKILSDELKKTLAWRYLLHP